VTTTRQSMTPRKGTAVRKTIQELRKARGESRLDLAEALGITLDEVTDWEMGTAAPGVERMRLLTEHFGIRDDQINLEPSRAPTLGEQLSDALTK
jgi:transcriptional regulator with XRE-family HTH domain